jgi:hypothetical protein
MPMVERVMMAARTGSVNPSVHRAPSPQTRPVIRLRIIIKSLFLSSCLIFSILETFLHSSVAYNLRGPGTLYVIHGGDDINKASIPYGKGGVKAPFFLTG